MTHTIQKLDGKLLSSELQIPTTCIYIMYIRSIIESSLTNRTINNQEAEREELVSEQNERSSASILSDALI